MLRPFLAALALCGVSSGLQAAQYGLFTYIPLDRTTAEITDYPTDGSGEVTIPSEIRNLRVTSIAPSAFEDCSELTSITIPSTVTTIGESAFDGCSSLESLIVAPENERFSSSDGVLFDKTQSTLVRCPEGKSGAFTVPADTTAIADLAFSFCSRITSVTLSRNVATIGDRVFYYASGMEAILVDPGNTHFSSLDGVLFNKDQTILHQCPETRSEAYTIPSTVTTLANSSFRNCKELDGVTIPPSVTSIGDHAFYRCYSLTTLALPPGVTHIDSNAFGNCVFSSIALPASLTYLGSSAFSGCSNLTGITIPAGITVLNPSTFYNCRALTRVTLPSGLTEIGRGAFSNCRALPAVTIPPHVTSIGFWAFYYCTSLTGITIPSSVTFLDEGAFSNCSSLFRITIQPGITSIRDRTFQNCRSLISVTVPPGVTSLGYQAFDRCSALTRVSLPSGLISIGEYAFSHCENLTNIDIPSEVTTIGALAFAYCYKVKSVIIPHGVKTLFGHTFYECRALTHVTIPSGVTTIEDYAFFRCRNLRSATFLGHAPLVGPLAFKDTAAGLEFFYFSGRTGFTSPTWSGYPASLIDEAAFPDAAWLESHGILFSTPIDQDWSGDGVSLLMAYALNLNPNLNLSPSMPVPELRADALVLSFFAGRPDITYQVEWSSNVIDWTTEGVLLSPLSPDGTREARVDRTPAAGYLRLVVGR